MAEREYPLTPIPKVNPITFNSYVNNYFSSYLSGLTPAEIAALIGNLLTSIPFSYYMDIMSWPSLDGWSVGGLTHNPGGGDLYLATNAQLNAEAYVRESYPVYKLIRDGKLVILDWLFTYIDSVTQVTRQVTLQCDEAMGTVGDMPITADEKGVGFLITNADIYAVACDGNGVSWSITDTGEDLPIGAGEWTHLTCVLKNDEYALYYVNGVLKATHTAYLPQEGGAGQREYHTVYSKTLDADAKTTHAGRILTITEW
jgi:hypothetical protein